jgi:hypothetical membrane protein
VRALLIAGAVGPLLFIVTFLIEGATRPGYSVWRNFVSQLATGDGGWVQIANFLICGTLMLAFTVGFSRALRPRSIAGTILIGVFGLALIVAGIFVTDPALGYPPGSSASDPRTLHGGIHGVAGLVAFTTLAAAAFVMARHFSRVPEARGWAIYSLVVGALIFALFVLSTVTSVLDERGVWPDAPVGILQRISIITGWTWLAALALRLLRTNARTRPRPGPRGATAS